MLNRVMLLLLTLMMVPTFASAKTFWAITATTSPAAQSAAIVPAAPALAGDYTTTASGTTNVTSASISAVTFNVSAPAGFGLVNVKVDNKVVGTTAGPYVVAKGALLSHSIVATYTPAKFTLSTVMASGGMISAPIIYSSNGHVVLTPQTGYRVTGIKIGATTYALASLPVGVTVSGDATGADFTFASGSYTVSGVFGAVPTATTVLSTGNQNVGFGNSVTVDGSQSTSNVSATYNWTSSCPGSLSAWSDPTTHVVDVKKETFTAPNSGSSCTVTLTMTGSEIAPAAKTVTFTLLDPKVAADNLCLDCHNGNGGPNMAYFKTSAHFTLSAVTCQGCHNPAGTMSHPFAALDAANLCATCHDGSKAPSHPTAGATCGTCHATTAADSHTLRPVANGGVTFADPTKVDCKICHNGVNIGGVVVTGPTLETATSVHGGLNGNVATITCGGCHISTTHGVLPGANACMNCHATGTGGAPAIDAAHASFPGYSASDRGYCQACHSTHGVKQVNQVDFSNINKTQALSVGGTVTITATCVSCHAAVPGSKGKTITDGYAAGFHKSVMTCQGCHTTKPHGTDGANAAIALPACVTCHTADVVLAPSCAGCHTTSDVHSLTATTTDDCVACHASALNHPGNMVKDNNGVRAITGAGGEFGKWSHHIINQGDAAPTAAQCAVCHLEGKTSGTGTVVVDKTKHMVKNDPTIHLRDGNVALNQSQSVNGEFKWNPADPNHTAMDQFCMSCHNADGAVTAVAAIPLGTLNGKMQTALNPFADDIQNRYDGLSRNAVVPVFDQFDPDNTSHHAVRAARYTLNTAYAGGSNTDKTTKAQGAFANISANNAALGYKNLRYANGKSYVGTLSDLGKWTTTYKPLVDNNGSFKDLADNSKLHCGDCHTVGQWAARGTAAFTAYSTAYGAGVTKFYKEAIGAHGSSNEYMLRNANGDGNMDPQALVCYICHSGSLYSTGAASLSSFTVSGGARNLQPKFTVAQNLKFYNFTASRKITGLLLNSGLQANGATANSYVAHEGVSGSETNHCNADTNNSAGLTGLARINTSSTATFARISTGHYGGGNGGNAFGIKCANCHNSGDGSYAGYGGIHGNAFRDTTDNTKVVKNASYGTYSSVSGKYAINNTTNVTKLVQHQPYRFLPGLGNFRYNGGDWTLKQVSPQASSVGCYTLNGSSTSTTGPTYPKGAKSATRFTGANFVADDNGLLGTWGACTDHAGNDHGPARNVLRPTNY